MCSVCLPAACAASGRTCSKSILCCLDVSFLQQSMLLMYTLYICSKAPCFPRTCLAYIRFCFTWASLCQEVCVFAAPGLYIQEPVLQLDVSFYPRPFCVHLRCLPTRAYAALIRACLQQHLCCIWTCLSSRSSAPGRVCLQAFSSTRTFVLHLDELFFKSMYCNRACLLLSLQEL
jgi:hypothetical protein